MTHVEFESRMFVDLVQCVSTDRMVANAARVSTMGARAEQGSESISGLINFLMKNRHGTPFEHGLFTFRVRIPIFVMRELHRHRVGFSYNEQSGRYSELDGLFYVPDADRPLTQIGKPGAYTFVPGTRDQVGEVQYEAKQSAIEDWARYHRLLDLGVAREVARDGLGVNIYSACYVSCNPRSLMHFLSLRVKSDEDTTFPSYPLYEIDKMASQMEDGFRKEMPLTHSAFIKNGRVDP